MAKNRIASQTIPEDTAITEEEVITEVLLGPSPKQYYLFMIYPEAKGRLWAIDSDDVLSVLKEIGKIDSEKENTAINLLLNSNGGDIYAAYKIINIIRERCQYFTVVIPLFAKSAATLMALGADRIVMGAQSELGPLDLPTEHPIAEGRMMSSLDAVRPIEYLAGVASDLGYRLGGLIRRKIGLSRRDSIEIALQFASDYIAPIISKLDPLIVNECYRELDIAGHYARELLSRYMLANKKNKDEMAQSIAHQLVWGYPSHEFAICINEAKRIGLEVCHCSEYPQWNNLWETFQLLNQEAEGHILIGPNPDVASIEMEIRGPELSTCEMEDF
jgi:hypothetical protein